MSCYDYEKEISFLKGWARAKGFNEFYLSLDFAVQCHKGQKRKGGADYIIHPIRVAKHAIDLGFHDQEALAGYMLHDVIEDCGIDREELVKAGFGHGTENTVCALTKRRDESDEEYCNRFYDINFERMPETVQGFRNIFGKLLDRCNNVSTMAGIFTPKRAKEYVAETHKYIVPLLMFAIDKYPQHSNMLHLVKYHIESVCNVFEKIGI